MISKGDVFNCKTRMPSKKNPHVYYVGGRRYRSATAALQNYINLWEKEHCPLAERKPAKKKDPEVVYLVRALLRLLCANRIRRYIIVATIIYKSRKKLEKLLKEK